MRTKDPTGVRVDFLKALTDIETTVTQLEAANASNRSKKLVYEYSLLAAAVLWESYVSDLLVAFINKDSSTFATDLVSRLSIEAKDKQAERAKQHVSLRVKSHLTSSEIRAIIDSNDYNITFKDVAALEAAAGRWLVPAHAGGFTGLTPPQVATIQGWHAIRNFLAHRSTSAKDRMQNALAPTSGLPVALARGSNKIHDAGAFLRAKPTTTSSRRLLLYIVEMRFLAGILCP